MSRRITTVFFVLLAASLIVYGQKIEVAITAPEHKSEVGQKPVISGTVSDPSARVWLIVRPTVTNDFWVQEPAAVNEDGTWQGTVHIGRPGSVDVGEGFQVRAVADPKNELKAGDKLTWWPKSKGKSKVIKLTRK